MISLSLYCWHLLLGFSLSYLQRTEIYAICFFSWNSNLIQAEFFIVSSSVFHNFHWISLIFQVAFQSNFFFCWSTTKVFKFKFFHFLWQETFYFCVQPSRLESENKKNASNNCIKFSWWKIEIYGVKNNWRTRKFELFFFSQFFDV